MPNFVDLETGGWGGAIQDPLNSGQTPTMANFATLADLLSGCVTRVKADACSRLFAASTPPRWGRSNQYAERSRGYRALTRGTSPKDSSPCFGSSMRYRRAITCSQCRTCRISTGRPVHGYFRSSSLAAGIVAGGKCMFDSEGNLWVGDNFTIGWQGQDSLWQGHATKFAPNGKPLSPITTGFTGGGMEGGTFGAAVDSNDNVWLTSYGSKSINVFDKNGKPLTPPEGINFGGRLGLMQGVIVTPSGDVWVLGIEKRQLVYFPKGEWTKGRIVCEGESAEPCKSFKAPFHLAIDQQDRIWVSNSGLPHVTRFPASDPSKAENFTTGINNSGLNIDSQGNVWVTNRFGTGLLGMAHLVDMGVRLKDSRSCGGL